MKKKNTMILGGFIAGILVVSITIYASYAYFNLKVVGDGTKIDTKTSNNFSVKFTSSPEINLANAELISDDMKETDAVFTTFKINVKYLENPHYTISLNQLHVSKELQSEYVKWEIYNVSTKEILSSGDFSDCTDCDVDNSSVKELLKDQSINQNEEVELGYRMWLSDAGSGVDQNDLLNGTMSGTIVVSVY